jgi:hypothetical protein
VHFLFLCNNWVWLCVWVGLWGGGAISCWVFISSLLVLLSHIKANFSISAPCIMESCIIYFLASTIASQDIYNGKCILSILGHCTPWWSCYCGELPGLERTFWSWIGPTAC